MSPAGDGRSSVAGLTALIEQYERPLMQYAARFVRDADEARDIVQETFLRLVKAGPRADEAHTRAWLYTVCRNLALDERRKESRVNHLDVTVPVSADESPTYRIEQRQQSERVVRLLGELPINQQEVVRLKFQSGLSYKEISEVTKLSVSNVGFLLHVAIKTLRKRLADSSVATSEVTR